MFRASQLPYQPPSWSLTLPWLVNYMKLRLLPHLLHLAYISGLNTLSKPSQLPQTLSPTLSISLTLLVSFSPSHTLDLCNSIHSTSPPPTHSSFASYVETGNAIRCRHALNAFKFFSHVFCSFLSLHLLLVCCSSSSSSPSPTSCSFFSTTFAKLS